ncbi:MAG TPA: hypothetical protein VGB98_09005 [Pyrinomonadaceae bacterium]
MKYAENTEVSADKSLAEIKQTLTRYGATKFAFFEEEERAAIGFEVKGRRVRFIVPLPSRTAEDIVYWYPGNGKTKAPRPIEKQHERWEKSCRQRWRALALAVKAKLEVVESGISTFEEEFLAYVVLPDGQTVGEFLRPQIETSYQTGKMPPLLPGIGETGGIN